MGTPYSREETDRPFSKTDSIDILIYNFLDCLKKIRESPLKRKKDAEKKESDNYIKKWADNQGFRNFENGLKPLIGHLKSDYYEFEMEYISALLIIDSLNNSFKEKNIKLPDKITALDAGCGRNWYYAEFLYKFLQNYNTEKPREVLLDGIDVLITKKDIAEFKKTVDNKKISPIKGSLLDIKKENHYDFILMNKMLACPKHFCSFGIKPVNLDKIMEKCISLLAQNGIQVTISPQSAGEYWDVVEHIPAEKRIAEFNYKVKLGNDRLNDVFTPGFDRYFSSGICISKK